MAPANFWTEKKKRHGAALSLHGTRGTVQVFERQGVQFLTWSEVGQNLWPVYRSAFTRTRVNTWTAQVLDSLRGKSLVPSKRLW